MLATLNRFSRAFASDGEMMRASAARQLACSSIFAAVAGLVVFGALAHHPVQSQVSVQPAGSFRHPAPIVTTAIMRVPSVMLATAQ